MDWIPRSHRTDDMIKETSTSKFYSKASPFPLPTNSLTLILQFAKISSHLLLRDSQDPLISNCIPQLRTGSWHVRGSSSHNRK